MGSASKRAKTVIRAFLQRGTMSTDELAALGYEHPPRAVRDVKDVGLPVVKEMVRSPRTGRPMAVYRFGSPDEIRERETQGRRSFSKGFRKELIAQYGSMDHFDKVTCEANDLTIDHRVPYQVAGDKLELDVKDYMLITMEHQHKKRRACELCPNTDADALDPAICGTCYWAFPENYLHVATANMRRTDVIWQGGEEVGIHDRLVAKGKKEGRGVADILREAGAQIAKRS